MEGTVGQPLVGDLAFQEPSGVHLTVGLEILSLGQVLGFFSLAGWTARDGTKLWREGQRETRFAKTGCGVWGSSRMG